MNKQRDYPLVSRALLQVQQLTGIHGEIESGTGSDEPIVQFELSKRRVPYRVLLRPKIDRVASLVLLKSQADKNSLLITHHLSDALGAKCRELGIQFLDTAGNAYLNDRKNLFVFVTGRKADEQSSLTKNGRDRTSTPAALRVSYALLARPDLLQASMREIAASAAVSPGAVGEVLRALQSRGYIGIDGSGQRAFLKRRLWVAEWANGYINRLKPKLHAAKFSVPDPAALAKWMPPAGKGAWGAEMAAALLTKRLKPGAFTLYKSPDAQDLTARLVKEFRLRADPNGELEVIDAFWDFDVLGTGNLVPPELIYADLVSTLDDRNVETANYLLETVISNA